MSDPLPPISGVMLAFAYVVGVLTGLGLGAIIRLALRQGPTPRFQSPSPGS